MQTRQPLTTWRERKWKWFVATLLLTAVLMGVFGGRVLDRLLPLLARGEIQNTLS